MRLLILTTCYPRRSKPENGLFAHRLNRALTDLGVDCHVLQPVDWAPAPPFHRLRRAWKAAWIARQDMLDEVDGIPVDHPRVYKPVPSRFFPRDYWERVGHAVAAWVRRRSRLRDADLLLAHFVCQEGYAGLVAARQLGMPFVAFALGDDVHLWPERWPDRRQQLATVLAGADGLLANCHALARDAQQFAPSPRSFEVVYHGIETSTFAPAADAGARREARQRLGLPPGRRSLLCVAWPAVGKGWLDLLDAFKALSGDAADWDLVMATPPYPSAKQLDLKVETVERGLTDRVVRLGAVPPDSMPDLYRAVDAFVLASHNEGLSNAVLEAMASGLPVVTTSVGGHVEIIRDGVSGHLVPPRDPDALRAALRRVFSDPAHAARMGAAARQRAIEIGDFRANGARLRRYLESVAAARSAVRADAHVVTQGASGLNRIRSSAADR